MGTIATEEGVLKLVCAGRRIERYKVPVTAAEVLRRYPRHSITRPDIFEYPWIVVKSDAVLNPGKVFFIVPNHTIRQLLKAKENTDSDQSSPASQQPQKRENPKEQSGQQVLEKTSSFNKLDAGRTPKHKEPKKRLKHQFLNISCVTPTTTVCPTEEHDYFKDVRKSVKRASDASQLMPNSKTPQEEPKRRPSSNLTPRSEKREGKRTIISNITTQLSHLMVTSIPAPTQRSCLRKPDSTRKLRQFLVSFQLPHDYVERETRFAADYRMQYSE